MKVSAFTFIRNGQQLGYPFVQSIRSALPLVDEFVVNVGKSEDDTLAMVQAIDDPKIKILETTWNENMRSRGFIYAQQKMIAQYQCTGDWAFYLEGDELIHEKDHEKIRQAMAKYLHDDRIDVLAFDYFHFYGNINTYLWTPAHYRKAVRIIKTSVRSLVTDALHWVILDDSKKGSARVGRAARAALTHAHIYHYGWARPEDKVIRKVNHVGKYWKEQAGKPKKPFSYANIDPTTLHRFEGTHPAALDGHFPEADSVYQTNPNHSLTRREKKHRLMLKLEKWFNLEMGRKFFKVVA